MNANPALQAIKFEVGLCRCCCFSNARNAQGIMEENVAGDYLNPFDAQ
jgi:hypothetical protein